MKMNETDWNMIVEYVSKHPTAVIDAGTRPDKVGKYLILRVPPPLPYVGPLFIPVELE